MKAGTMLPAFKIRLPLGAMAARVATAVHQAAYLGTTYACISLAAVVLGYVYETHVGRIAR